MNRVIKFRGVVINDDHFNGQWWEGSLRTTLSGKCFISAAAEDGGNVGFEVDPATVGQFTGRKSTDGKEIYEDDLLSVDKDAMYASGLQVLYKAEAALFGLTRVNRGNVVYQGIHGDDWHIIGNIHDQNEDQ